MSSNRGLNVFWLEAGARKRFFTAVRTIHRDTAARSRHRDGHDGTDDRIYEMISQQDDGSCLSADSAVHAENQ